MKKLISSILMIILLSSLVLAAGGVYYYHSYEKGYVPLTQNRQTAFINYDNGREDMLILVQSDLRGGRVVWIFPVPAEPDNVEISVLEDLPKLSGYDVKSRPG